MAENRTKITRINLLLQLVFALVVFLGVNLLGNRFLGPYRIDLSQDQLFTLSPGTENTLEGLDRPLTLKFFFSENNAANYPELYRYGQRVEDFLNEIEILSDGKITLEKFDPEAFSSQKTEAEAYGLINLGDGDEDPFYLGMVGFDDTNRLEVISRFSEDRERFLEYDLAKVIYLLAQEKKPRLGIISGLPLQFGVGGAMAFLQGQSQSYLLYSQLAQFFDVQLIEGDFSAIASDIDVLLLVHPPILSDRQLFAIDQYVLAGNPTLVFVDPFAEISPFANQNNAAGFGVSVAPASDLAPLLETWGLRYDRDLAVIDPRFSQQVEVPLSQETRVLEYPHWLGIEGEGLNPNDPVTGFLTVINLASSGSLIPKANPALRVSPLILSSEQAFLVSADRVRANLNPASLLDEPGEGGRFILSAYVQGTSQSAFPNGVEGLTGLSEGQIKVIVTADADIFEDRFWAAIRQEETGQNVLVPVADNAAFVVNAIDYLAGSEGLVSLRARGVSKRPLEKFQMLRQTATQKQAAEQDLLRRRLAEAQTRLADIEGGGGAFTNNTQSREQALREFRNEIKMLEKSLTDGRRALRLEIQSLENKIILLNVFVIPLGLFLIALIRFSLMRRGRKRP